MSEGEYLIVDDFQVNAVRVLVLDRVFEFNGKEDKAIIDGKIFSCLPNSVKNWILIESPNEFKGKTVKFI